MLNHRYIKATIALLLLSSLIVQYDVNDGQLKLSSAYAQVGGILTINWEPPTQYTDNTALLEQDLDFYTFYCNGAEVKQFDSVIGTRSNAVDISALPPGDYACDLTVTALPDTEPLGKESAPSTSKINFTIGDRVPGSPSALTTS